MLTPFPSSGKIPLPIFAIVLVLSVTFAPMESGVLVMFLFGTLLLIVGMGFFTVGSGISIEPLGENVHEEREIIAIFAPSGVASYIMEDINRIHGVMTDANGMVLSVPVDKAFKI